MNREEFDNKMKEISKAMQQLDSLIDDISCELYDEGDKKNADALHVGFLRVFESWTRHVGKLLGRIGEGLDQ